MKAPIGKGIYVCDKRGNKLSDAIVKINEMEVPFDNVLFQYRLPEEILLPCKLTVEHKHHPSFRSNRFFFDSQYIYLTDEASRGYWAGGIKEPVHSENIQYLLLGSDFSVIDTKVNSKIDEKLSQLLQKYNPSIEHVVRTSKMGSFGYVLISFPSGVENDKSKVKEIHQIVTEIDSISFFGPCLIRFDDELSLPFGLTNEFEIKLLMDTSEEEIESLLKEFQLQLVKKYDIADGAIIVAQFDENPTWNILKITEKINKEKVVRYANNRLVTIATH